MVTLAKVNLTKVHDGLRLVWSWPVKTPPVFKAGEGKKNLQCEHHAIARVCEHFGNKSVPLMNAPLLPALPPNTQPKNTCAFLTTTADD